MRYLLLFAFVVSTAIFAGVLPAATTGASGDGHHGDNGNREIVVMTRNLFVGTDYESIMSLPTPPTTFQVLTAVETSWQQVLASRFSERAEALADEVAEAQPDIIGLQEVSLIRTVVQVTGLPGPRLDYLDILLSALGTRGLHYAPVAAVDDFDVTMPTLPAAYAGSGLYVHITDREVLLARTDLSVADLQVTASSGSRYAAHTTLLGTISLYRGWVSVDVKVRGKNMRVVSTHLEPYDPAIQLAQAQELIAGPGATKLPLVLIGDFNSGAPGSTTSLTPTYAYLAGLPLDDAWATLHPATAGLTCCQDVNLGNATSRVTSRIDLVLSRGFRAKQAYLVGDQPDDRTAAGLWPSDHAGVVAALALAKLDRERGEDGG